MNYLTRRADQIVKLAKEAAREYGQGYVGTEHLLLGIVREGTGLGARILMDRGATEARVQAEIDKLLKTRMQETWVLGRLPGTPHFKDVLAKASSEARGSGNWQICSVHLLLALLTEKGSTGHKALGAMGISLEIVRKVLARKDYTVQSAQSADQRSPAIRRQQISHSASTRQ